MSTFYERFRSLRAKRKTLLCTGLDPDLQKLPSGYSRDAAGILEFLNDIIEGTAGITAAYKPNLAFFESLGPDGMHLFSDVIQIIKKKDPEALIIADAKRGDIGNTALQYAKAFYDTYGCDAVTVSPYMGMDTVEPFLQNDDKAAVVLCLTSNPGADQFERHGSPPLFLKIAEEAQKICESGRNVWLVVGATKSAEDIKMIRSIAPDVPFLVPGVGAQGGDMKSVLQSSGPDCLINASRSILYAASAKPDVSAAAEKEARSMSEEMNSILNL